MSASTVSVHPHHPNFLDDELAALTLQLEELRIILETGKGKHAIDNPPDTDVAFTHYQVELAEYHAVLHDQRFAQSMGTAVHTDGSLIEALTSRDVLVHDDRSIALNMSTTDPDIEAPPAALDLELQNNYENWISSISGNIAAKSVVDFSDDESEAGPSMTYTERQANTLKKLSTEFECVACTNRVPRAFSSTSRPATKALYPPKCCRQPIPLALVARHMVEKELAAFQLAQIEYSTRKKIYCSNHDCGLFIVPSRIDPGTQRATCAQCGTATCAICNNAHHQGKDCPDDPLLQETKNLAQSMGWQTCSACDRVVELRTGCNHMTCHCGAEFCYCRHCYINVCEGCRRNRI
ncbi:hypothetical protein T440DRAFT_540853 [Plenodomus tracheiphilus IPT5]|uniref:RBR-type E3 ubiquitin transferase n=1 Tax=Plenodomus tracheiphilus IPT5 TaxID=1408161 RepID=A0A6A7AU06_9PLEO|nr:hypothetical protein T440DRAFT_540853 [Plenodomus tracheiphilus IPT5]